MPNTPLPKPAAPVVQPPSAMPLPGTAGTVTVQPPQKPSIPAPAAPTPLPQKLATPPVSPVGAPPAPMPAAPVAPTPSPRPVAPTQPLTPQPVAQQPVPMPKGPIKVQQPPQTLSALSSMASNRLPSGAGSQATLNTQPAADPSKKPTVQPASEAPKPKLEFVQPKRSLMSFLPYIGGGVLLLLIIGFVAMRFLGGSGSSAVKPTTTTPNTTGGTSGSQSGGTSGTGGTTTTGKAVTLEYWGLWEPSDAIDGVISDFETSNPNITIKYTQQSYRDYRTRLQQAVGSGNGPDVFRFHATWVPMLKQELAPLPSAVMSANEFASTFYPVAAQQLQTGGQLIGLPIMYDGLVLYYNTDIFTTAVVEPPTTWSELRTIASKLTVKSGSTLTRSGAALGNATNVEHFADIIAVLMLQNGADLTKPNSAETRDALLFYTNFIKSDGVWSDTLPSSTVAFARGETAMMFAPSWRAHEIAAMNPDLKFATAPLPQLSETKVTWASYWAEGVSSKSENKDAAWKFLKYLSSKEAQQKLYAEQSQLRSFGEIYARKDLADQLAQNPVASSVLQDAPYAKGFGMSTYTHDAGLNDMLIQYYTDAVNALLEGEQIDEVLVTLEQGVNQALKQYAITTGTSASQ